MIVVKIELWSARTGQISEIGRMYITNRGDSADKNRGNYDVRVCRRNGYSPNDTPARTGQVLDYPRLSYNVWRLIKRALKSTFPEER